MDLLDKIDSVLASLYLKSGENPTLKSLQKSLNPNEIDIGEIRDILQKLHSDGFLRYEYDGHFVDFYDDYAHFLITFDGKFFYESIGGYKQKLVNNASENTRLASLESSRHEQANSLNVLTKWIAVGTMVGSIAALIAAIYYLHLLLQCS